MTRSKDKLRTHHFIVAAILAITVLALSIFGLGQNKKVDAAAPNSPLGIGCTTSQYGTKDFEWTGTDPSAADEWNQAGYNYYIYSFTLQAIPDGNTDPPASTPSDDQIFEDGGKNDGPVEGGDIGYLNGFDSGGGSLANDYQPNGTLDGQGPVWITSENCGNDLINTDAAPYIQDGVEPVAARLGFPAPVMDPAETNGNPRSAPYYTPQDCIPYANMAPDPTKACPNEAAAAFVDDAGRAEVNNTTIWCEHYDGKDLTHTSDPADGGYYSKCDPDILDYAGTAWRGAGYLFTSDNCGGPNYYDTNDKPSGWVSPAQIPTATPEGPSHNPITECDNDWYINPAQGIAGATDLTPYITLDASGNLKPFHLHMQAENTYQNNLAAVTWLTFKYPTPWKLATQLTSTSGSLTVTAGQTASMNVYYDNSGGYASPDATLQISPTTGSGGAPQAVNPYLGSPSNVAPAPFVPVGYTDCTASGPSNATDACTVSHWSSDLGSVAGNTPITQEATVTFVPPAATPDGTQMCFSSFASPADPNDYYPGFAGGDLARSDLCFTVINPSYPYFNTTNGDVHVGGLAGTACTSSGILNDLTVGTQVGYTSTAQYIASAAGVITNFSSAGGGAPTPGYNYNSLTFGNDLASGGNGDYGTICRPNLAKAAVNYIAKNGSTPTAGNNFSASTLTGTNKLWYHNGDVTLNAGSISGDVTLYVNGNVTITGNIAVSTSCTYKAATLEHTCPSFGLIATGSILINPSVTQLAGFYSAGNPLLTGTPPGIVDTCNGYAGNGNPPGPCANDLNVTGFLQGYDIDFHRTCPGTPAGPCQSEHVSMSPVLYLSPPPAFDAISNGEDLPQYEGELPPLN